MKKILLFLLSCFLLVSCMPVLESDVAQQEVGRIVAKRVGYFFAKHNPEMAEKQVKPWLKRADVAADDNLKGMVEEGFNWLLANIEGITEKEKALLRSDLESLARILDAEAQLEKVKLPDSIDKELLRALLSGFELGIDIALK